MWSGYIVKYWIRRLHIEVRRPSPLPYTWIYNTLVVAGKKGGWISILVTYRQYKQLSEASSLQCSSFEHFECKMWLRLYFTCHELNECSSESTGSRRISLFSWDSITLFKQHSKLNHTSQGSVCFSISKTPLRLTFFLITKSNYGMITDNNIPITANNPTTTLFVPILTIHNRNDRNESTDFTDVSTA
jgi:hypothetical protein